ncbi:MAG: cob(I)yrinic acid a,c-diamide adenosyltransferase [Candidatus Cloacimonetes bacterium]|nr:cob(I)yrinic acid a,c-diamide adenosyltransferase [Candidatus Cloacimonadota bacterium]MDY0298292.1 cob(I)yrinic acid a,c-diamide adenosyltransferase [Candidatus Cloacimonadaceae bacterium]MCB5279452.1 cob(I)yrinic acid a,c-diamide adenosyltransferase [Candidatus Cloacimonadota bacterium]MCK9332276.1 cob(I)yrinic acid a,c-diamide adenosyltransferase [Candidatus Cloacimonadota bacterium]MDD2209784.1 cob(I)yrinic acid a,c-diamide adenosyltransferase [Candidatus Cloacimonadota bacterium]
MSITTKGGDTGQTSLYTGGRVYKSDLRVEAYGSLDELDAFIGEAKHHIADDNIRKLLLETQNRLYRVMGELATPDGTYPMPLCEEEVETITQTIRQYEEKLDLKGFVIPGSCLASARLDICRTVARRAERRVIALAQATPLSPNLLKYINRLSDFFFILARVVEAQEGVLTYKTKPDGGCGHK